jgi:HSP20 family protein
MAIRDLIPWGGREVSARREEQHPFFALQQQMNRLFDDFTRGWGLGPSAAPMGGALQWDEDEQEHRLTVELPGLGEKDVEVRLAGDTLTIRARKEETEEDQKQGRKRQAVRSYYQQLTVPPGIDRDHVQAELKNGVLTLCLPKTEEARRTSRRIDVKSA